MTPTRSGSEQEDPRSPCTPDKRPLVPSSLPGDNLRPLRFVTLRETRVRPIRSELKIDALQILRFRKGGRVVRRVPCRLQLGESPA